MNFENRYSKVDRILHRVAFTSVKLQVSLSDMEDHLFSKKISLIEVNKPVFITAIPRAGTTLLLELLVKQGEFASHCYRDMPFVLVPMLWEQFSRPFRKDDELRERAHGDGMLINVDSPEAFEEMIWKAFWKNHYTSRYIVPWEKENDDEFSFFLQNHLRKIIFLRSQKYGMDIRYVSKNNLNISRIDYIRRLFPDATIVLPFRSPVQHAASLLKQHLNFISIHKVDKFAKKYMQAVGHYDFGENLRPVDFSHWYSEGVSSPQETMSFWLEYWLNAYNYLLRKVGDQVKLFSYEAFCEEPAKGLRTLGEITEMDNIDTLVGQEATIKAAKPHTVDASSVSNDLVREANDLFSELQKKSIV